MLKGGEFLEMLKGGELESLLLHMGKAALPSLIHHLSRF